MVDGERHDCSEDYYHSQKPDPFSDAVWDPQKEAVMEKAVRANVSASLRHLLQTSGPIKEAVGAQTLTVVGAEYNLSTGAVAFLD